MFYDILWCAALPHLCHRQLSVMQTQEAGVCWGKDLHAALQWVSWHWDSKNQASCLEDSHLQTAADSEPLQPNRCPMVEDRHFHHTQALVWYKMRTIRFKATVWSRSRSLRTHWHSLNQCQWTTTPIKDAVIYRYIWNTVLWCYLCYGLKEG